MDRRSDVRPTGIERRFGPDEIIVTKTDLKGRVTYANDVFLRISAYAEPDVLGQPHSIVRHPDMPRAVFKLLWDTLAERRELFSYVCNLAADGAHYWVFAHITPSFSPAGAVVGYHSARRVASPHAIAVVKDIYTRLLAAERGHTRPVDAAGAGLDLMQQILAEQNLTYDEWVWTLASESAAA